MKVIKPQKLGVLTRTFERARKQHFVVSTLAMFPLSSPTRLFPEPEMWKFATSALGANPILDEGWPKTRGELLITGDAISAAGPVTSCAVRAQLGTIDKRLSVFGDRVWPYDAVMGRPANTPSSPVPFERMSLDWTRAYGGEGYAKNPIGRGYWRQAKGEQPVPLPNVESPDDPVTRASEEHEPVGLGAYDFMWPQRFVKVGTYDGVWLKEQFPGFALDMDLGIFNSAPQDQQLADFFRGDETFAIENMHPASARLAGRLPALLGRAFITQRTPGGESFREIGMRLDTVRLFPNQGRGLVIFRGVTDVAEDDADDVVHLLVAAERLDAVRLSVGYYQDILSRRLDHKKAAAHALRDRDLLPEPDPDAPAADVALEDELADVYKPELLPGKAMSRRRAKELERTREALREAGLEPAQWNIEEPAAEAAIPEDPVERAESQERMIADARVIAKEEQARAEALAREQCARAGFDYDELVAKAKDDAGGPPKFSARAEMTRLQQIAELARIGGFSSAEIEAPLTDPRIEAKLVALEAQLLGAYRSHAHHFPPARSASGGRSEEIRREIVLRPRGSFAGRDLTGVDLSGLDLSEYDFTEALLESAVLTSCRLTNAVFAGAVLARAFLDDACLDGADLTRANLGAAILSRATFKGARLNRAVLVQAQLAQTSFEGATLDDADVSGARFTRTRMMGASAARLTFSGCTISDVAFDDALMPSCRFLDCSLEGVSFRRADLTKTTMMAVLGRNVAFDGARLDGLRLIQRCDFSNASFRNARLVRANLRESLIEGADFTGADLSHADLSKARAARANLHLVVAREARFDRADLSSANLTAVDCLLASFQKAKLAGADLRGSSFFGADFLRIFVDESTRLDEGALLERVRYVPAERGR